VIRDTRKLLREVTSDAASRSRDNKSRAKRAIPLSAPYDLYYSIDDIIFYTYSHSKDMAGVTVEGVVLHQPNNYIEQCDVYLNKAYYQYKHNIILPTIDTAGGEKLKHYEFVVRALDLAMNRIDEGTPGPYDDLITFDINPVTLQVEMTAKFPLNEYSEPISFVVDFRHKTGILSGHTTPIDEILSSDIFIFVPTRGRFTPLMRSMLQLQFGLSKIFALNEMDPKLDVFAAPCHTTGGSIDLINYVSDETHI
jgi:hypothetical protein